MKNFLKTIRQINSPKKILPVLMVMLTRHPRYFPEFEWGMFWTYNLFRIYEMIFGRRYGIRREASAHCFLKDGRWIETYQFHSLEAGLTHIEEVIRNLFKWKFKLPFKIWIPILSSTEGLPFPSSPFMFAIALDTNSSTHTSTTPHTFSYTVTGSNPLIATGVTVTTQTLSSSTYNGTTVAAVTSLNPYSIMNIYLNVLGGCATGAHNVVNTYSANPSAVADEYTSSYSGCSATGQPDASNSGSNAGASSITVNVTVVASNCWLNGVEVTSGNTLLSNSANTTIRSHSDGVSGNEGVNFDSNATVGTGSQANSVKNTSGTSSNGMLAMSIKPPSTVNTGAFMNFF